MSHDHPVFTRLYQVISRVEDGSAVGAMRTEVAAELSGRLLIVGLGPAGDLHHLPAAVTEVVAVEPSASMRRAAEPVVARTRATGLPVEVLDAVGESLPLPDDSVDSVLFAYVLCTVDDPARVIAEAARVLRPGGSVGVIEHVAAGEGTWMRRAQRALAPLWPHLAGGCNCDRPTADYLAAGGFDVSGLRQVRLVPVPPVAPAIVGTVRLAD